MAKRKVSEKLIKLKRPPTKPQRKNTHETSLKIYGSMSVEDVLWWMKENAFDAETVFFKDSSDYWEQDEQWFAVHTGPEPEWFYEQRLSAYNKKLDAYKEWYTENSNLIEKEKTRRVEEEEAKEAKREKLALSRKRKRYEALKKELEGVE